MNKFSFAHLLGLNKSAKASRAEEEEEERDAEEEEENEEDDSGKSSKKGKKANDDKDDPDAEDDDDPDAEEDDDDPDAEDDDPDAEEDENKDVKKGRKAERQRCSAIFGSPHAAGRPDLAATLAFTTRLSAKEAIRVMRANGRTVTGTLMETTGPKRKTLQERMSTVKQPRVGANGGKSGGGSVADQMKSLYNHATGSAKK